MTPPPASSAPRPRATGSARCFNACHNCKRRKEKCDGAHPCGRCIKRKVECHSHPRTRSRPQRKGSIIPVGDSSIKDNSAGDTHISDRTALQSSGVSEHGPGADDEDITVEHHFSGQPDTVSPNSTRTTVSLPRLSRLIRHSSRSLIYIGKHGNSAFLHSLRRVVQHAVGSCALIDDAQQHRLVDGVDVTPGNWLQQSSTTLMSKPDVGLGKALLDNYLWTTDGILHLLDRTETDGGFEKWLTTSVGDDDLSAKYYLVLAIGTMACKTSTNTSAEALFASGRFLAMVHCMDKPSITGAQCFLLITMFLVMASRRNAASMNLGIVVHTVQALGIHQQGIANLFKPDERQKRENIWKSLRLLDVFLNGSLGRPLATWEKQRPVHERRSATLHLCWITQEILRRDDSADYLSIETMEDISSLYREWASSFPDAAARDGIDPEIDETGIRANLGLLHIRNEYYLSIILLTRQSLLDLVANVIDSSGASEDSTVFAHACVDSAAHIVECAASVVLSHCDVPRKLPFLVNAVFLAGLVLGLGVFAGLEKHFPLHELLERSIQTLRQFSEHDLVARRGQSLVSKVEAACRTYISRQGQENFQSERQATQTLFGSLNPSRSRDSHVDRLQNAELHPDTIRASPMAPSPNVDPVSFNRDSGNLLPFQRNTHYYNVENFQEVDSLTVNPSKTQETSFPHEDVGYLVLREGDLEPRSSDILNYIGGDLESVYGQFWEIENAFSMD